MKVSNYGIYHLIPVLNILHIPNCFDGTTGSPFCLMFNKETYNILGGTY